MQFWSGEHLVIEIHGPQGAAEVVVPRPFALIGALARAEVRLSGDGVQKREALLYVAEGKIRCRRLEGALPELDCELPQGEWLTLRDHQLRARLLPAKGDPQGDVASMIESDSKPRIPVLRVRRKGRPSVTRRLFGALELVGRGEDCEVALLSTQVSLYHCVLLRESNRLWCVDLASGNGTFLNGQKIECAPIEMGGRLRIGDFELEFQRYSRRSASASSLDDAVGSQLRLGPMSVGEEMPEENIARGSGIGTQASDSIFGNRIITNSADVVFQALSADDVEQLATKQDELLSLHANMRDGLAALTDENVRLRSDHEALAQQLSQRLDEQRAALLQELKQQALADRHALEALAKAQAAQVLAQASTQRQTLADELLQRVEERAKSQAQELKLQFDTQRLAATQELTRRLEAALESQSPQASAASDPAQQVVAPQWLQRLDDLRSGQSEEIALAVAMQAQALSQELVQRLEAQQAELSRELLAQMESHRMALLQEQQAAQDTLTQRLQPLLATLDQLVSRQSQWSSQLASQAEQIQATRQTLGELQSRTDEHPVFQVSEPEFNAPPTIVEDRPRETSLALLNGAAPEGSASTRGSEIALLPPITLTANAPIDSAATGRKADTPLPEDDHLLHFVSDRLAEMDSGRQRWMLIYWAIALGFVGIVGGVTWALWSWLSNQPAAS